MADKDYTFGLAIDARAPDNRFDYRLSARAKTVIHLETGESVQYTDRQQVRACPVRDLPHLGCGYGALIRCLWGLFYRL